MAVPEPTGIAGDATLSADPEQARRAMIADLKDAIPRAKLLTDTAYAEYMTQRARVLAMEAELRQLEYDHARSARPS